MASRSLFLVVAGTVILFLALVSSADVPHMMSYSGTVTKVHGGPLNGTFQLTFSIYPDTLGSPADWIETHPEVVVKHGLFSVLLGSVNPIPPSVFDGDIKYLGVQVESDPEMRPLTPIVSVAYAYRAGDADIDCGWVDDGTVVRLKTNTDKVGIGTLSPEYELDIRGSVGIGSSAQTGSLSVYLEGSTHPVIRAGEFDSNGGKIRLYDEMGNSTCELEPDLDGEGGYFRVKRSTTATGFSVNGNYNGTNEPNVWISGSERWVTFDMSKSGNSSVRLPTGAIFDYEILDEPGVASNKEGISEVELDNTLQTLLYRTIYCPSSGYVLVIGTAQLQSWHTQGTFTYVDFGVSTSSASLPNNQDVALRIDDAVQTGEFEYPITVHGLFEVNYGDTTFYFLAQEFMGDSRVSDMQLTLVYFPTAYGTVIPTKVAGEPNVPDDQAPKAPAITSHEMAAERAEAKVFNAARIERELAEMRAELDALKQEFEEQGK